MAVYSNDDDGGGDGLARVLVALAVGALACGVTVAGELACAAVRYRARTAAPAG
jgi:hypothetical protein